MTRLTRWQRPPGTNKPTFATLTPRQATVLDRMCRGRSNTQIADDLWLSDQTVKTHVKAVLKALKAQDRTHATYLVLTGRVIVFVRGDYTQESAA